MALNNNSNAVEQLYLKGARSIVVHNTLDFSQFPLLIGEIGAGMPADYMTFDQRFAARRTDVLTYQTEPLDHDVRIAGPVTAVLRVSTSGTDSDFVAKLIDVYPND